MKHLSALQIYASQFIKQTMNKKGVRTEVTKMVTRINLPICICTTKMITRINIPICTSTTRATRPYNFQAITVLGNIGVKKYLKGHSPSEIVAETSQGVYLCQISEA